MKFKTIVFTYTGEIAKNYGVDGTAIVEKNVEFTPDNIKDENIAKIWVREGFAEYKENDKKEIKKPIKEDVKPEIKYEDVSNEELEAEINEEENIEEVQLKVEEVSKPSPKKRGRPAKK